MNRLGSMARSFTLLKRALLKNRPFYVHYGITHRCNLRCRMCSLYRQGDARHELSCDEISRLFDFFKSLGVVYVSIGGGEPGVRQDLASVCGMLVKKGLRVRVLTNGTALSREALQKLSSAGVREVSVSLDTLGADKFDAICGVPGSFVKIMESIEWISSDFPRRGRLLLLNTVVSALNIGELPRLHDFAGRRGYFISFLPLEGCGDKAMDFFPESHDAIDRTYDTLLRLKHGKSRIFNSSRFLELSRQYLKTGRKSFECDAGRLYFSVGPDGGVSICHHFKPIMDVATLDRRALASKAFRKSSQRLSSQCPGCLRPCWAEISLLAHHRGSFLEMARLFREARR